MVMGKKWLFSIGNGAEIRPLEKGRNCPDYNFFSLPSFDSASNMLLEGCCSLIKKN